MRIIKHPHLYRLQLNTTVRPQDDAFGWLDYVSGIREVGIDFLRDHGHPTPSLASFYLFQSFIRQAQAFYSSAESLAPRSSPLNYYYAFLNLAKAYILVHQPQFTGRNSSHGLGFKLQKGRLSKQFLTSGQSGIYPNFYRQITGMQLKGNLRINIIDLLGYCSDIAFEYQIGQFGRRRVSRGHVAIAADARNCWIVMSLQNFDELAKYKNSLRAFRAAMEEVNISGLQAREMFGIPGEHRSEFRFFESKGSYSLGKEGEIPVSKMVREWVGVVNPLLSVAPYPDAMDFQLDFPLRLSDQKPMKEPLATYAVIFFLSSLVRYHPDFLEALLASRDAWIIERFVRSAPVTLLLYMRNLIAGRHFAYRAR